MRAIGKLAGACAVLCLISIAELPYLSVNLIPDAHALRGRGAAFVVGSAAGSANASAANAETAAAQQQAATAQQQAAAAEQKAAAAEREAAAAKQQAAAAAAGALPLGTVVPSLPAGCGQVASGGVAYYQCGGNTYQAVYEGSTLKYVTTKPK
jgi:membrane protein involved in colicin uptake